MDRAVLENANDRYQVVEYLAEGGMGAIYLGKKLGVDGFEKEVVLKQLLPEYTEQPKFIELFLREARLSATLDHANIVRTVDLLRAGADYFMVMEYVRGADLRTLTKRARRRQQRFSPAAALYIAHEILEALTYAHGKSGADGRKLGLIHRDVSPSNILVSGDGEIKLTDFGIASAATQRSVFRRVRGKVGYMSPEQARGEKVDPRSDLFSAAVCFYEALVGERAYVADLMSPAAAIYAQKVAPPSKRVRHLPRDIDRLFAVALSIDPARRFQTAEEFRDAVVELSQKNRLLITTAEMRAHLRKVCGDDPAAWPRLESLGWDAPAGGTGTARVEAGGQTDQIDDEDAEEPDEPRRRRTSAADWPRSQTLTSLLLGGSGTLTNTRLPGAAEPSDAVHTGDPTHEASSPSPGGQTPSLREPRDAEEDAADLQTTDVVANPPSRRPTPTPAGREAVPAPRPRQSSGGASPPVRRPSVTQAVRPLPPSRPVEIVPSSRRRIILGALFAVIGIAVTTSVALVGTREPAEPHARPLGSDSRRSATDEPPLIDPLRDVAVPAAQVAPVAPPAPPAPPAVALPPQKAGAEAAKPKNPRPIRKGPRPLR